MTVSLFNAVGTGPYVMKPDDCSDEGEEVL